MKTRYSRSAVPTTTRPTTALVALLATCRFVASVSGTPALVRSGNARVASAELV
jgi:hypothetical protein